MALLADDELSALQTQMAHTAAQASQPTYPLAPSVAPKEPTWVDSSSGGYYDDGLGHYSNNGGASWDYTPEPYAATSYAPPQPASTDPYGYNAPYVTPATAPGEYGNDTYAPPPQDNQGNPWLPTQGPNGGAYINNVGQFWDSETQSWADSSQPTALGNYYSDARGMPSYSDIAQDRAAWSPTREQFIDFDRASDVTSQGPYSRYSLDFGDQSMANFADSQFGWNGQPKNAFGDLGDEYNANNANPSTGIMGAFNYLNSTNDIVRSVGGPDLDKLPYGLGYITDAINPVTLATAALGPSVPIVGSAFGSGIAKRAIGETAVNAAGMALSDYGGDKVAEHTDNPWLEGAARLGFGVVGAGGIIAGAKAAKNAPRALRAVDDAIAGLDARIMEPTGGGMGRPVTAGSVRDVPKGQGGKVDAVLKPGVGAGESKVANSVDDYAKFNWKVLNDAEGNPAKMVVQNSDGSIVEPYSIGNGVDGRPVTLKPGETLTPVPAEFKDGLSRNINYFAEVEQKYQARRPSDYTTAPTPPTPVNAGLTPDVPVNAATTPSEGVLGPVKPRAAEPPPERWLTTDDEFAAAARAKAEKSGITVTSVEKNTGPAGGWKVEGIESDGVSITAKYSDDSLQPEALVLEKYGAADATRKAEAAAERAAAAAEPEWNPNATMERPSGTSSPFGRGADTPPPPRPPSAGTPPGPTPPSDGAGGLDMDAIDAVATAPRGPRRSPVGRAIARVTPGAMEVTAPAPSSVERIGNILHAPLLPEGTSARQILKVDGNLTRRADAAANTIDAEAATARRALGKTKTMDIGDTTPNVVEYYPGIKPSEWEVAHGIPGASALGVTENPGLYNLTPAQKAAIKKLDEINGRIANERDLLGDPVNRLGSDEGEVWMHRKATTPAETTRATNLVEQADPRSGEFSQSGGSGRRLSIGKDKTRQFDSVYDAMDAGVQYAPVEVAFRENVASGLTKAKNAHIKGLLEPLSDSAGKRTADFKEVVDASKGIATRLEGRLNTALRRAGIATSRGDDLAAMLEKQATGAAQRLDSTPAEIATINRFLTRAQNRIVELRQRGGKYADEANALQDMLNDARANVDELLPQWEKAKQAAASTPPGRATVSKDIAPALIGMDFDKQTAARITAHYGGGIRIGDKVMEKWVNVPGAKAVNAILHPVNATLDASVTFNQLAMLGATNKVAFVKNFAAALVDAFSDTHYNKWLTSAEAKDAARWVTIYGESGGQGDLLSRTLQRAPGFAQAQNHFSRFGNRMRVDSFNAIADSAAKSAGRDLDDAAREQIGRAVDRMSGVSMNRATDLESIAQFAPNFFRSILENVGYAASNGGLEGQIARQYIKNYATLGGGLVVAAAVAQNRDLGEVLNPFDKKAWARGEIRINPNWMTIRVAGQDVSVFGTYDSAMRLAVVMADAGYRAASEKDGMQLFDALGYAAGTKGSAPVKFITDLIKGETWGGGKPLDKVELGKRLLPISLQQAAQSAQEGRSLRDIAKEFGLSAIGIKSNPVTGSENRNELSQQMFNTDYDKLPPTAATNGVYDPSKPSQRAVDEANGGKLKSTFPETIARNKVIDANRTENVATQQGIDANHIKPGTTIPKSPEDGKAWRAEKKILDYAIREQWKTLEKAMPYTGPESKNPMRLAMNAWGAEMDAAKNGTETDYDRVDKWMAEHPAEAALVNEYMAGKVNTDLTEVVTAKKAAYETVAASGMWQVKDDVWAEIAKSDPNLSKFASYYDFKADVVSQVKAQAGDAPDVIVDKIVQNILDKNPIAKVYSKVSNAAETQWVIKHPKEAGIAYQWGYFTPTDKERAIIAAGAK